MKKRGREEKMTAETIQSERMASLGLLVAGVALFASVLGGVAGYGTGALMPLVLVPMVGAEQVVPIIALAGMLTNTGRTIAVLRFRRTLD